MRRVVNSSVPEIPEPSWRRPWAVDCNNRQGGDRPMGFFAGTAAAAGLRKAAEAATTRRNRAGADCEWSVENRWLRNPQTRANH